MKILAIDTATGSVSAALIEEGRVRAEAGLESFGSPSTRLLAEIDRLLASLGWTVRDLDGFALTPGPGSFTGIRIGMSTVQALAFACDKPIAAVSSLKALAWKIRHDGATFAAPLHDARKGEIYAALYAFEGGWMTEAVAEGVYTPGRFLNLLPGEGRIMFIGGGFPLVEPILPACPEGRFLRSVRPAFAAAEIGLLGAEILAAGKGLPAEALKPIYYRRSQAEEGR